MRQSILDYSNHILNKFNTKNAKFKHKMIKVLSHIMIWYKHNLFSIFEMVFFLMPFYNEIGKIILPNIMGACAISQVNKLNLRRIKAFVNEKSNW